MARLRYNGLRAELAGSGLTNSATSVTFAAGLTHSNGTNVPTLGSGDYIPLAILDTSGHLSEVVWLTAYTAAATTGTIARGQEGTSGVSHSSGDKVVQAALADDVVSTGVIASVEYASGSAYTTTSSTAALIDTTNLVITFIAPSSGAVMVEFHGLHNVNSAGQWSEWSVFESGSMIAGTSRQALNATGGAVIPTTYKQRITGLTPGSSHTYKWGWKVGGGVTATLYANVDKALMTIVALP